MNVILYLAEAFFVAYMMRIICLRLKIPAVSGYVVGGVILGGSLFFWIPDGRTFTGHWLYSEKTLADFQIITQIALGIIALSIGTELEWKRLKHLGKSIISIAFCEATVAFVVVTLITYIIWKNISLSLILGAISSATAPAATVAVIQQYKAKGPLTSTILAVVGLDDAISFIIFAFALAIAKSSMNGEHINLMIGLIMPFVEVIASLLLGTFIGLLTAKLISLTNDQENLIFILGAMIFLVAGIASKFNLSELLANMACGSILINVYPLLKNKIRLSFRSFMPIFSALFFIIGGAHLNLYRFPSLWFISLVYFLCRAFGKIFGAFLGAAVGKADPLIKRWVGFTLLPQVGAAIALALVVQQEFGNGGYGAQGVELAQMIINVLLITTLITEFIGPFMTKTSLFKLGEAKE
ncbi:MAG: cation:proton antiporter [Candidatus Latescibacteria bacterium]|nr:cation:proton antiporter [Candidatus Latescibacterota bacterium]